MDKLEKRLLRYRERLVRLQRQLELELAKVERGLVNVRAERQAKAAER